MERNQSYPVQRALVSHSIPDIIAVSTAMFGMLLLSLLFATHGTLLTAASIGFLAGWTLHKTPPLGRKLPLKLQRTPDESPMMNVVRQVAAAL